MSKALLVFWMLVGFSLSGWIQLAEGGDPWPEPDPKNRPVQRLLRWSFLKLAGTVGGLLGGWLYTQFFFPETSISGINVAITAVGASVGSLILSELTSIGLWFSYLLKNRTK
jgi:hypothetical protein